MTHLQYVFCHGLSGWGEYDKQYAKQPYWGLNSGDVVAHLRSLGYDAHAASVAPSGSAWDRACELYAQLAGTRVDYGRIHAMNNNHDRWGKDYTGRSLFAPCSEETKYVLIGHSFGGITVRLLAHLLKEGDREEQEGTHPLDLSPLFKGGMGDKVAAIILLAAPSNGTTAYDMYKDPSFDPKAVAMPLKYRLLAQLVSLHTRIKTDGRKETDYASYDMGIDRACALNETLPLDPDKYYFSVTCCCTDRVDEDYCMPDMNVCEAMFARSAILMGHYKGTTPGGRVIDESWQANDGLVNVISARSPLSDPSRIYENDHAEKGIWNILPDFRGDHGSLQGGYNIKRDLNPFYEELLRITERALKQDSC